MIELHDIIIKTLVGIPIHYGRFPNGTKQGVVFSERNIRREGCIDLTRHRFITYDLTVIIPDYRQCSLVSQKIFDTFDYFRYEDGRFNIKCTDVSKQDLYAQGIDQINVQIEFEVYEFPTQDTQP